MKVLTGYMDEVGKGSFFGPLVVCMIICEDEDYLRGIGVKDSKKLTPKKREAIYELLINPDKVTLHYSYGIISNTYIDKYGIESATKEAYERAYKKCCKLPTRVIMDGNYNYLYGIKGISVKPVVKGDDSVIQIGAASILAKVYRDRMISKLAIKYPGYKLESNKGYGTKDHIEGILDLNITKLHRKSFTKGYI